MGVLCSWRGALLQCIIFKVLVPMCFVVRVHRCSAVLPRNAHSYTHHTTHITLHTTHHSRHVGSSFVVDRSNSHDGKFFSVAAEGRTEGVFLRSGDSSRSCSSPGAHLCQGLECLLQSVTKEAHFIASFRVCLLLGSLPEPSFIT